MLARQDVMTRSTCVNLDLMKNLVLLRSTAIVVGCMELSGDLHASLPEQIFGVVAKRLHVCEPRVEVRAARDAIFRDPFALVELPVAGVLCTFSFKQRVESDGASGGVPSAGFCRCPGLAPQTTFLGTAHTPSRQPGVLT